MTCRIHRRGNAPCPAPAMFAITYRGAEYHRAVCAGHLIMALEDALAGQTWQNEVKVSLYAPEDPTP